MSRWWRAYDEALHDPKMLGLSDRLHRAWFNLLCVASKAGGILPGIRIIALELRCNEHKAAEYITALVSAGLIDRRDDGNFIPHNWGERQYVSDVTDGTAALRQQRYRDRRRNATVTNTVTQHVTTTDMSRTPESDTDSESEREKKEQQPIEQNNLERAVAKNATRTEHSSFAEFWDVYPKRTGRNPRQPAAAKFGLLIKAGFDPAAIIGGAKRYAEACRKDSSLGTKFVATAIVWLNQHSWQDYPEFAGSLVAFKRPADAPPEDPRWVAVKAAVIKITPSDNTATWLDPLEFEGIENGAVKLSAPSLFHRNHIIQHYGDAIFEAWQEAEPDALKLLIGNKKAAA